MKIILVCSYTFVPRTTTDEFDRRSFHAAAPVVRNALPTHLRSNSILRGQFRAGVHCLLLSTVCINPLKPTVAIWVQL